MSSNTFLRGVRFALCATFLGAVLSTAAVNAQHDASGEHGTALGAEAAQHGDGAHGGHARHWDMFQLSGSIVNFVLWLLVMYLLMRKSVPASLKARKEAVAGGIREAEVLSQKAQAKFDEYSAKMANIDAELQAIRDDMMRAGNEERDRILADASRRAQKMREEAVFLATQQVKQVREELLRGAVQNALTAAEAMLIKELGTEDQSRLGKEYLSSIKGAVEGTANTSPKAAEVRL